MKRIGIMTAGGDCAGLNVVLKTLVKLSARRNWKVIGIRNAVSGLIEETPDVIDLNTQTLPSFIDMISGSFIGANIKNQRFAQQREMENAHPNRYVLSRQNGDVVFLDEVFETQIKKLKLDALILTGGDDSLRRIGLLCEKINLPIIGIPKTIDNDIQSIDRAIGFDTGVQENVHFLDNLRTTAASHQRVMVLETMGNTTGHLAMHSGLAGGADAIIVPEFKFSKTDLLNHLTTIFKQEQRHYGLVVVSEGVKPTDPKFKSGSEEITSWIQEEEGLTARLMVGGHAQRGGHPSADDRILATRLTAHAMKLLEENHANCMLTLHNGKVIAIPLEKIEANSTCFLKKTDEIVQTASLSGIYVGDIK
ncbi:MAG: ATP-dependent 6-phosphofructokinase [Alphaproteobacteria bacterium]|nr:ATP-dependent 6-phosphofructokinase [Alphaproteobacteria bacterium]